MPCSLRGGQVDIVDANAVADDGPRLFDLANHLGRERSILRDDGVGIAAQLDQLLGVILCARSDQLATVLLHDGRFDVEVFEFIIGDDNFFHGAVRPGLWRIRSGMKRVS